MQDLSPLLPLGNLDLELELVHFYENQYPVHTESLYMVMMIKLPLTK